MLGDVTPMRQRVRGIIIVALAMLAVTADASGANRTTIAGVGTGPLETAIGFSDLPSAGDNGLQLRRIAAAGAKYVELRITWSSIAPSGTRAPAGFRPKNPADPHYDWSSSDSQIKAAVAAGLEPIVVIVSAPRWAERPSRGSYGSGTYKPGPGALANFLTAAAKRYGGSYGNLPRVQYWAIWNEPNLSTYLTPQMVSGKSFAPGWYRLMLNAAANALHAAHSDNVVIGGETAPFGVKLALTTATKPLTFMEKVLCVYEKRFVNPRTKKATFVYWPGCKSRTKVDVWSHHPYTQGGPTTHARIHGNVSLGDLGEMRAVLRAAVLGHNIVSSRPVRLWVTEFSWDTSPPDPKGVPAPLEARWVAQALYQMWSSGVSLSAWFLLRDLPFETSYWQSGLYFAGADGIASDRPKPALRAFRFPFVALPKPGDKVLLWARTPGGVPGSVVVERKAGSAWRTLRIFASNSYGIFKAVLRRPAHTTYLRARLSGDPEPSVSFALTPPRRSWEGCVWGTCNVVLPIGTT